MPFGSYPLQLYEQSFLPHAISLEQWELSPWAVIPSPADSLKSEHWLFRRICEKTKNTSCIKTPFTAGWNWAASKDSELALQIFRMERTAACQRRQRLTPEWKTRGLHFLWDKWASKRVKWPPTPIDYQKMEEKWKICYCFSIIIYTQNLEFYMPLPKLIKHTKYFQRPAGLLPATGFFVLFQSILKWRKHLLQLCEHLRQGSEASEGHLVLNFTTSYSTFAVSSVCMRTALKTILKIPPGWQKLLIVY